MRLYGRQGRLQKSQLSQRRKKWRKRRDRHEKQCTRCVLPIRKRNPKENHIFSPEKRIKFSQLNKLVAPSVALLGPVLLLGVPLLSRLHDFWPTFVHLQRSASKVPHFQSWKIYTSGFSCHVCKHIHITFHVVSHHINHIRSLVFLCISRSTIPFKSSHM